MNVREIDASEREKIQKYMLLDENSLYSLLPQYVPEYDSIAFSPQGILSAGMEVFGKLKEQIHSRLCIDWNLCGKLDDPIFGDSVNLIVIVGDVISSVTTHIPPFLVSSIIFKIGIRKFCNCHSKGD